MNAKMKTLIACALTAATLNVAMPSTAEGPRMAPASPNSNVRVLEPRAALAAAPLSPQEAAKYGRLNAKSRADAKHRSAGASQNQTVWIVVGAIVVVRVVIAVASHGGGGGGGGGY